MATPLLYAIMSQEPVFFKYFEYCLLTSILAIGHTKNESITLFQTFF